MEQAELDKRFTFHPPKNDVVAGHHEIVRAMCLEMATALNNILPESDEKERAFTALDGVMFCSNAAIARNQ